MLKKQTKTKKGNEGKNIKLNRNRRYSKRRRTRNQTRKRLLCFI
jgi:hypothetical protein